MSTSKPTPAPWNVDLETGEIIAGENGNYAVLGTIYSADDFPCNENDIAEECKANARLIAAAPELLEALQALVDYHATDYDEIPEVEQAISVIKAATGE